MCVAGVDIVRLHSWETVPPWQLAQRLEPAEGAVESACRECPETRRGRLDLKRDLHLQCGDPPAPGSRRCSPGRRGCQCRLELAPGPRCRSAAPATRNQ